MVVDEIDDLTVIEREPAQARAQDFAIVFARQGRLGAVTAIGDKRRGRRVERGFPAPPQCRQRFEPRNGQDPGCNRGPVLEPAGVAPPEKHLGGVLGGRITCTMRRTKRKTLVRWRKQRR
jgi:hypothetical protein